MSDIELYNNSNNELSTPDEIEWELNNCLDIINSSPHSDTKEIIEGMIKAQLAVVNTCIKNPTLCNSAIDLIIETLSIAEEDLTNKKEIRKIQRDCALMINSIVFFLDSYLYYKQDKHSKDAEDLLKEGCKILAETINDTIIDATVAASGGVAVGMGSIAKVASRQLFENVKTGFLDKILSYFFAAKRLEEYKNNHYAFLKSTIEKIYRHKELFGKSIVLSEMIRNHALELTTFDLKDQVKDEEEMDDAVGTGFGCLSGCIFLLLMILGAVTLLNLTPINLDNTQDSIWSIIKYAVLICIGIFIIYIIYRSRSGSNYGVTHFHYQRIADEIKGAREIKITNSNKTGSTFIKTIIIILLTVVITYTLVNNIEEVKKLIPNQLLEKAKELIPNQLIEKFGNDSQTKQDTQIDSPDNQIDINTYTPVESNDQLETLESIYPDIDAVVSVDELPQPIIQPPPIYPQLAQLSGLEGTVYVKILVGEDGTPKRTVIHKSDAEVFNDSAIEAAMNSSFTPAILNNEPVACWVIIPYKFRLKN